MIEQCEMLNINLADNLPIASYFIRVLGFFWKIQINIKLFDLPPIFSKSVFSLKHQIINLTIYQNCYLLTFRCNENSTFLRGSLVKQTNKGERG